MLPTLARQLVADAAVGDAELLARYARSADAAAFELLVWRHGALVWAACRRVLGADLAAAEDASQAAFAALARHAGRVRNAGPWLHRVAVRAALDLLAAGRGRRELPASLSDPHPGPERVAVGREEREAIDAAVNELPEKLRAAFVLCELEGRPNAEAAAALGCPVGTVESRLTRARQRLRARLADAGVAPAVVVLPAAVHAALLPAAVHAALLRALAARAAGTPGTFRYVLAAGLVVALGAVGFSLSASQPPAPPPGVEPGLLLRREAARGGRREASRPGARRRDRAAARRRPTGLAMGVRRLVRLRGVRRRGPDGGRVRPQGERRGRGVGPGRRGDWAADGLVPRPGEAAAF